MYNSLIAYLFCKGLVADFNKELPAELSTPSISFVVMCKKTTCLCVFFLFIIFAVAFGEGFKAWACFGVFEGALASTSIVDMCKKTTCLCVFFLFFIFVVAFGEGFKAWGCFGVFEGAREEFSALPLPIDGESRANILNRCALFSNSAR